MVSSAYWDNETMQGMVHDVNCLFTGFHDDGPHETLEEALMAGMLDNVRIV